jgi:hypothetical protein
MIANMQCIGTRLGILVPGAMVKMGEEIEVV